MTAQKSADFPMNVTNYQKSLKAVEDLRNGYTGLASDGTKVVTPGLNMMMQATGQFNVSTVKAVDSTTKFTKSLMDQKVGLGQVLGNFKSFRNELDLATKQQVALQKASAMQWTTSGGKSNIDMYVPTDLGQMLADTKTKYGMINYAVGQIGQNTLNWGKNTQWAGRQITAGLSMPIALAAAGMAKLALDTDKQLTEIAKVYNTQTSAAQGSALSQAQAEAQLSQVRTQSMQLATQMAEQYGAKITDTLNIEAQLAQMGKSGQELYTSTAQVMRVATLGDMDYNTALQLTMTLMNAFHETGQQLGDTFNFINAVENSTSLSTKDVADALPRVGAAMASLGMSVQETTVLLTAFKEGGIDATTGANALKTAVARMADPTPKTVKYFSDLDINIKKLVNDSGGDFLKFMEELGPAMAKLTPLQKETGLKDLFGVQQSDRLLAVLENVSAITNKEIPAGASQTATAFKLMSQSASDNSRIADQEIRQFQTSASGQFKIAIATIQTELVKIGDPIMRALTPILGVITSIIKGFNNAPSAFKTLVAGLAIVATVAGPLIMLVGLFANLFGNALKFGSAIGSLFTKFKPLTEAEAAEQAIGKLATQTYNQEAQAVALLAQKMGQLNAIMKTQIEMQQAAMAGAEEATAATDGLAGANTRAGTAAATLASEEGSVAAATGTAAATARTSTAVPAMPYNGLWQVGANGQRVNKGAWSRGLNSPVLGQGAAMAAEEEAALAAGMTPIITGTVQETLASRQSLISRMLGRTPNTNVQSTNVLGNLPPIAATRAPGSTINEAETRAAANETAAMAGNAEKTRIGFTRAVGALAGLGVGVYAVKQMADGTGSVASNIMNGVLAMGALVSVAATLNLKEKVGTMLTWMKGLGTAGAEGAGATAGAWGKVWPAMKSGFSAIGSAAKFLFTTGPGLFLVGLTAAAAALYIIHQRITQASRDQEEINKSTDAWSSILGYTQNTAKALNDVNSKTSDGITATKARQTAVNKLTDANGALVDRLKEAAKAQDGYDSLYNVAMNEAVKVKVDGGSNDQAKQAFEVALQAAGLNQVEINKLDVKFDTVNLDDPAALAAQLGSDIQTALQQQQANNHPGGNISPGFWDGGPIADDAKATAERIGSDYYTALQSVANDPTAQQNVTQNFGTQLNNSFAGTFNKIRSKNQALFKDFGINSIDDLNSEVQKALDAYDNHKASDNQKKLVEAVYGKPEAGRAAQFGQFQGNDVSDSFKQYQAYWDDMLNSIGASVGKSGDDLTAWKKNIHDLPSLLAALGGPTKSVAQATDQYNKALDDYKKSHGGQEMADDQKLIALNAARATAGLGPATSVTQGFGAAAGAAGNAAAGAAQKFGTMAEAMKVDPSTMVLTDATQYVNEMKSAYSGAVQTMTGIASTLMQRTQQAQQAGIQAAGDKRLAGMQAAKKKQDAVYDAQTKAAQDAATNENKAIADKYKNLGKQYDAQIKQAQDAAKVQTDGIQSTIDALNKEDATRQKLFDNEKTRIQRLAQLQNNNIDFNSALNSGNLDAAAKVYSSNQATVQGWSMDDQQAAMTEATKAKTDAMSGQIDAINKQTQAYVDGIQAQKDALSDLQAAEEEQAQKRQQAAQDYITQQKQAYDDAEQASETADQKKTQSALAANQTMWQDKQAKLQMELSAITASIPQTDAQYQQQIKDIEGLYSKYGVDLQGYAGAWGGNIGNALTYNMQSAAASLQNDIGWSQISTFIQSQLDSVSGLTMDQVASYLRTGNWPASSGTPQQPKQWFAPPQPGQETYNPNTGQSQWHNANGAGGRFHVGGFTGPGGKYDPAGLVHKGEFVFPQEAVNNLGVPFLSELAGLPGYANGGLVRGMVMTHMAARAALEMGAAKQAIGLARSAAQDTAISDITANMSGGLVGIENAGMTWKTLNDIRARLFPGSVMTSGYRPGATGPTGGKDYHNMGDAIDIGWAGNNAAKLAAIASTIARYFPNATELIHNPNGSIKNGKAVPGSFWGSSTWNAHKDHVHWAMTPATLAASRGAVPGIFDNGGYLQPGQYGVNHTKTPEPVFTDEQWGIMRSLISNSTSLVGEMASHAQAAAAGNVASESGPTYNVTVDMTGANVAKDIDMEKAVFNALAKLDYKNGRSRNIS